ASRRRRPRQRLAGRGGAEEVAVKPGLAPGVTGEVSVVVEAPAMTVGLGPDGALEVYSTPRLIWDLEEAARAAVRPFLEPGEESVGALVQVRHLAPTPVGMRVTARARLTAVEGRRLTFEVEAFDEREKVGEGVHQRVVVETGRFAARVAAKR
ncbi:MAG TPA: hotdog domain-containing protein, partial [Thermodesulfobacteriota bacterium]|nr:hotdog domain-containing protein [Thermodesulfobacteriota bacterium]